MLHQVVLLVLLLGCLANGEEFARWSNKELEVIRTQDLVIGSPLVIAAKHREGLSRQECYLINPAFDEMYWIVEDGVVYDANNNVVEGVEAWTDDDGDTTCGIRILEMTAEHLETGGIGYMVFMIFDGLSLFNQPELNTIKAIIHMTDEIDDRLPILDNPEFYDIQLLPDLTSTDPTLSYTGNMTMISTVGQSSSGLFMNFHLNGPWITSLKAYGDRQSETVQEELNLIAIQYDLQANKVMIMSNSAPLNTDDKILLKIGFEAELPPHGGMGLYKILCRDDSDMYCWFTQFESTGARMMFPCVDQPDKKAVFNVQVGRQVGVPMSTLFNMPLVSTYEMDGVIWDMFEETPIMSTYLLALAIQDYVPVQGPDNVTVWADSADVAAGLADYSADYGARIIQYYSETFQFGYTLPKMDMVSVPHKGGAMENWGLILYAPSTILYDQTNEDEGALWRVAEVVAHELAHQWFGNLVTMKWWDQTWLNEGFATYVSYMGVDNVGPGMNSWGRMVVNRMFKVMKEDSTDQSWAISDSVKNEADIDRKFGSITYSKGASLVRMMEGMLGANTLYQGLAMYLDNLQYDAPVEVELFGYLEEAGILQGSWPQADLISFTDTMKTWTQQAGYPLVTVKRSSLAITFSQSWYRLNEADSTEQLWDIPLNGIIVEPVNDQTADWEDTSPQGWLTGESLELDAMDFPQGPLIINKKATGYYRVNYDEDNWIKIANLLATNHTAIHPLNRAQIICDIYSLVHTGHVTEVIRDTVFAYKEKETDFTPLYAFDVCNMDFDSLDEPTEYFM